MFTNSQRRTIRSLERDVGCKFDFINPPAVEDVLESSAQQVVATLSGVHQESIEFFTPTAQKLIEEQGASALAAALAQLSGFSKPPSSRSLITHEQVICFNIFARACLISAILSLFYFLMIVFVGMDNITTDKGPCFIKRVHVS